MILIRFTAGLIVWLFIIGALLAFSLVTGFCFYHYHNFDKIKSEIHGDSKHASVGK
jgi:hypothetical protein